MRYWTNLRVIPTCTLSCSRRQMTAQRLQTLKPLMVFTSQSKARKPLSFSISETTSSQTSRFKATSPTFISSRKCFSPSRRRTWVLKSCDSSLASLLYRYSRSFVTRDYFKLRSRLFLSGLTRSTNLSKEKTSSTTLGCLKGTQLRSQQLNWTSLLLDERCLFNAS